MIPRWSRTLSALAVLAFGSAASLAAQGERSRMFTFSSDRPRIGVMLQTRADKDTDRLGARIAEVTPDGPADQAGLKAGDIITRFNGVALGGVAGDDDESGPAAKLVELVRKLEKSDTVDVEYRRGTDTGKVRLAPRELPEMAGRFRMHMPEMPDMPGMDPMRRTPFGDGEFPRMPMNMEGMPGDIRIFMDRHEDGLNLVDLNPDLGEYFGAKSGVLVLETPKDSTSPLRAGDVLTSIDGRAVSSEGHARRILGSYDAGETAKLEVLRKQKKLTLSWKAPSHERSWKWKEPEGKARVKVERS